VNWTKAETVYHLQYTHEVAQLVEVFAIPTNE